MRVAIAICDYLIKSDIELLNFVSAEFDIGLRIISVHYINASPKTYIRDPALHYVCYEDVVFELKIAEMTINIVSLDSLCFQEVFRNRPFAMFCSLDKRLVLHASAIESGGNVFGFCGPKGAGKTTLALYLSNCFKLFTDDQLCLFLETNDVYTISPDNIQKITKNTADVLSLNNHCGHYHPQYQKYIYITVNDCCCGAGCLLIAFANEARKAKIDFQNRVIFVAQDLDFTAAMMCYIQLSLLGCKAIVKVGNSLTDPFVPADLEGKDVWYTPMYTCGNLLRLLSMMNYKEEQDNGNEEKVSENPVENRQEVEGKVSA